MTTEERLERQGATFEFKNGKVKAFSFITQYTEYDTLQEAVDDICKLDERYDGKSFGQALIDILENT